MFDSLFPQVENCLATTRLLLRLLRVDVTKGTLKSKLTEHASYPSLLSISDTLNEMGFETLGANFNKNRLRELPTPFLAQVKEDFEDYFVVVKSVDDVQLIVQDVHTNKFVKKNISSFEESWTGIIMAVEDLDSAGETDYNQKRKKEILESSSIVFLFLSIVLAWVGINNFSHSAVTSDLLFYYLLFLIKLTGIGVTTLLLSYEIGSVNPLLQRICTSGKKTNCGAVLQSKGSRLFGFISWSEIGFFYFSGGLVSLLLSSFSNSAFYFLAFLNLLALPYIFYSIFYQWKIAKQWCILCLVVQAILILEFCISIVGGLINFDVFQFQLIWDTTIIIGSFLFVIGIWYTIKSYILKAIEGKFNKTELQRLKNNPQILQAVLEKQKRVTVDPRGLGIILGSPDPSVKIIKVCNPYCDPCSKAHPVVELMLKQNREIQVQTIFTVSSDENDKRYLPVKHLLDINEQCSGQTINKAMDAWYLAKDKNYVEFANKYPLPKNSNNQKDMIEAMAKWCTEMEISYTPTFFINGFQLPQSYSIEDVKNILN